MSWLNHLENLRGKSEAERQRLTFWLASGITALVAIIWLASWGFTLSSPDAGGQVAAVGGSEQVGADSLPEDDFFTSQKTRIIEGWKVITRQ